MPTPLTLTPVTPTSLTATASSDTAAIQAQLNAAHHIHFPGGTYDLNGLVLHSNLLVTGDKDAVLRRNSGYTGNLITDSGALSNVWIVGVTFDNQSQQGNSVATSGNTCVFTNGASGVTVQGCKWQNLGDASALVFKIGSLSNSDITIDDCTITGPSGTYLASTATVEAVAVNNARRCKFTRNRLTGCGAVTFVMSGGAPASYDLLVANNSFDSCDATNVNIRPDATGNSFELISVTGNHSVDAGTTRGKGFVSVNDAGGTARDITITNNIVRHSGVLSSRASESGINGTPDSGTMINVGSNTSGTTIENVVISDNNLDGRDSTGAIEDRISKGIHVQQADGYEIADNVIRGVGLSGIEIVGSSTAPNNGRDGNISDNIIIEANQSNANAGNSGKWVVPDQHAGIHVYVGIKGLRVSGNTIRNSGSSFNSAYTAKAGILVAESATVTPDSVRITGNHVYDDRGTKYQQYGVSLGYNGGVAANGPTNVTVERNDLSGNATAAVKDYATTNLSHYYVASRRGVQSPTAGYTVLLPDDTDILVDATAAPVTVTIPNPVTCPGYTLTIKKTDATANAVTTSRNVDGGALSIATQNAGAVIISDGTNWKKIGSF